MAISAVDNAAWDWKAKLLSLPLAQEFAAAGVRPGIQAAGRRAVSGAAVTGACLPGLAPQVNA